jgi:hypothetical protein
MNVDRLDDPEKIKEFYGSTVDLFGICQLVGEINVIKL